MSCVMEDKNRLSWDQSFLKANNCYDNNKAQLYRECVPIAPDFVIRVECFPYKNSSLALG